MLMPFTKDAEAKPLGFIRQARSGRYVMIDLFEDELLEAVLGRDEMERRTEAEDAKIVQRLQNQMLKPAPWWKVWR
jgi:hypothetical protein